MKILLYGVSHQSTPLDIRERFAVPDAEMPKQLKEISKFVGVHEVVLISTCNRTEYYLYVDETEFMHGDMLRYMANHTGFEISEVISTTYGKSNTDAGEHLFKLATGMDSLIVGETQILGQVKSSLRMARLLKTVGPILGSMFNKAISFAKRMHTETNIERISFNPGKASVLYLDQDLMGLEGKKIVLIGAGKMIYLTAKELAKTDVHQVIIMNRNEENAEELAHEMNELVQNHHEEKKLRRVFSSSSLDNLAYNIASSDSVIVATFASEYLITTDVIDEVNRILMSEKMITFIDLSVPRNIQPEIGKQDNVSLIDLDTMSRQTDKNEGERAEMLQVIQEALANEVERFNLWYKEREAVPYLEELQKKGSEIRKRTLRSIQQKIPDLSEHDVIVIEKHLKSIVNHLNRSPIQGIKEAAKMPNSPNGQSYLELVAKSLGLGLENDAAKTEEAVKLQEGEINASNEEVE